MQVILMTQFIMVRIILLQVFFFSSNDHQLWYNHLTITYIYTDLVFIPELWKKERSGMWYLEDLKKNS